MQGEMDGDRREFAHGVDEIFPSCRVPLPLHDWQVKQELQKETKGKKRIVKQVGGPNQFQIQIMHEKTNDMSGYELLIDNLHIKANKLSEVVSTRISNLHSNIRDIIKSLAEID